MARSDSEASKSDRELIEETAKRARRIETKVTIIADSLGLDKGSKPTYDPVSRRIQVPTAKVSLEDVLAAMEDDVVMVQVFCGDVFLASICPD